MNVRLVRQQLTSTERVREELAEARAHVQQQLDEQLGRTAPSGPFAFDAGAARQLRGELARYDERLQDLADRIVGLTRQLPSTEQIAEGRARSEEHQAALAAAEATFDRAAEAYLGALDVAEQAARTLYAARLVSRDAQAALADTVAAFGLEHEVRVPGVLEVARVPPAVQKVTHLQALFIGGATLGGEDAQVGRELAAAVAELQLDRVLPREPYDRAASTSAAP